MRYRRPMSRPAQVSRGLVTASQARNASVTPRWDSHSTSQRILSWVRGAIVWRSSFVALRSARSVGSLLVAVPVVAWVAQLNFPSYDDRPQYFAGWYHNIVNAGNGYLVTLVLFLVVAGLLVTLAAGLARSPLRTDASSVWAVVGGLGVSAAGFITAGLTGIPVWMWASQVADGSETLAAMAARSQSLAAISQNVLLMFGLGGLLVAMSVLGVAVVARGWFPRLVFWGTVIPAVTLIGVAAFDSGPVIWSVLLPMLWAFAFGVVLLIRGQFSTTDAAGDGFDRAVARSVASHKPQAEDWWLASDGKWYPPESRSPSPQTAP